MKYFLAVIALVALGADWSEGRVSRRFKICVASSDCPDGYMCDKTLGAGLVSDSGDSRDSSLDQQDLSPLSSSYFGTVDGQDDDSSAAKQGTGYRMFGLQRQRVRRMAGMYRAYSVHRPRYHSQPIRLGSTEEPEIIEMEGQGRSHHASIPFIGRCRSMEPF